MRERLAASGSGPGERGSVPPVCHSEQGAAAELSGRPTGLQLATAQALQPSKPPGMLHPAPQDPLPSLACEAAALGLGTKSTACLAPLQGWDEVRSSIPSSAWQEPSLAMCPSTTAPVQSWPSHAQGLQRQQEAHGDP